MGEKTNVHTLFRLMVANDGQMQIRMYTELDFTFWAQSVKCRCLNCRGTKPGARKDHQTKLPGIVGWNLTHSLRNMGQQDLTHLYALKESILYYFPNCASFSFLMYKRTKTWEQHLKSCPNKLNIISPKRQMTCPKNNKTFRVIDGSIGQVTIGSKQNPVCVPSNSVITVLWQTNKIPSKITCLVEQVQHHNLPLSIVINRCVATTKARSNPVILINTTKQNVWILQSLLADELFTADKN